MKLRLYPYILLTIVLAGCQGEEAPRPEAVPSDTEIMPQAVLAETRSALEGAVDGNTFESGKEGVFAVTATLKKDSSDPDDIYFLNQAVNTLEDGSLRFDEGNDKRFYPYLPEQKLWFYAYSPAKGVPVEGDPMKVRFELTGQEDVMIGRCTNNSGIGKVYANADGTTKAQEHPKFEFEHLLTRFNFKIQRGEGYGDRLKVNRLQVYDVENALELDLQNGAIYIDPNSKSIMEVEKDVLNVSIGSATPYASVMCGSRKELSFNVTSMGIEYPVMTISSESIEGENKNFEAGKSYDIILTFTGVDLKASASLTKWEDGGSSAGTIIID